MSYTKIKCPVILFLSFLSFSVWSFESAESGWWLLGEAGYGFGMRESSNLTAGMPNDGAPILFDDYDTHTREGGFIVGLTGGYQWQHGARAACCMEWLPASRLGIGYEYVDSSHVKGDIRKYQEQVYYNYHYKLYSQVAWLSGQLDILKWHAWSPFIDLGIGSAFNHTSGYTEERVNGEVPVRGSADFKTHTNAQFAWRAGLGLNYTPQQTKENSWTLGLLVRYSDLGEAKTGHSATYPSVSAMSSPFANIELLLGARVDFE